MAQGKNKKIKVVLKLTIEAGKATPAPPIGPTLGQHGVNIQEFVTQYNDKTRDKLGDVIPCILTVYEDRTFSIELKTPPVTHLLLKAAGLKKGSGKPNLQKIGKVTKEQIREIAEKKMGDLNATSMESAIKTIEGSAKSLGMEVKN
jgi:large subunit ribosomal protein L11